MVAVHECTWQHKSGHVSRYCFWSREFIRQ